MPKDEGYINDYDDALDAYMESVDDAPKGSTESQEEDPSVAWVDLDEDEEEDEPREKGDEPEENKEEPGEEEENLEDPAEDPPEGEEEDEKDGETGKEKAGDEEKPQSSLRTALGLKPGEDLPEDLQLDLQVNGKEEVKSLAEVRDLAQRGLAADERFAEAANDLKEAGKLKAQAREQTEAAEAVLKVLDLGRLEKDPTGLVFEFFERQFGPTEAISRLKDEFSGFLGRVGQIDSMGDDERSAFYQKAESQFSQNRIKEANERAARAEEAAKESIRAADRNALASVFVAELKSQGVESSDTSREAVARIYEDAKAAGQEITPKDAVTIFRQQVENLSIQALQALPKDERDKILESIGYAPGEKKPLAAEKTETHPKQGKRRRAKPSGRRAQSAKEPAYFNDYNQAHRASRKAMRQGSAD